MKKFLSPRRVLAILALLIIAIPTLALAAVFRADGNVPSGEIVIGNLYLAGPNPVVGGNVQGDLLVAGGNVTITGKIEEDVLALGGNITITGDVSGDVRAMGGSIYLDSNVNGEVIATGGEIKIGPNAKIRKDLVAAGGSVTVDSQAKVFGSTKIEADENGREATEMRGPFAHFSKLEFWIGQLLSLFGLFVVAAVIFGFFPNVVRKLGTRVYTKGQFWPTTGLGLLLLIVTPVIAILLMITMIGAMLGVLLLFAYIAYILVSLVISGILFGEFLNKWLTKAKKSTPAWVWVLGGIAALRIVCLVPFVGPFVGILFFLYAMGSVLSFKWKIAKAIK
ncbi:hypothetical protein KJ951_04265 [Patescibacteria group bacterium]|nr:hypothetical protein [Patescibacteria group bacterium]